MTLPLERLRRLAEQDPDSTDIFQTSNLERYWARPSSLTDICLAEFVAAYNVVYKRSRTEENDSEVDECSLSQQLITLQDGKGTVSKRKRPCIIRYMRISKDKDTEKHYSNLLRLFLPHRGKKLKPDNETYEGFFMAGEIPTNHGRRYVRDIVPLNQSHFEHNADAIDDAWQMIQEHGVTDEAWGDVAPNAEELRQEERSSVCNKYLHE